MRTIGPRLPSIRPRDDYESQCNDCGVHWFRSRMQYNGDGRLLCPDCWERGASELAAENAAGAARYAAALARPRPIDSKLFPDGDAAADPAVTFEPYEVLLDLNAELIEANDGELLPSVEFGGVEMTLDVTAPTYVARDDVLRVPVLHMAGLCGLLGPSVVTTIPYAVWAIFRPLIGSSRLLTSLVGVDRGQIGISATTGLLTVSNNAAAGAELTAPGWSPGDWGRVAAGFTNSTDDFVLGNRRLVTGTNTGSEVLQGVQIRSVGSTSFRLHRLLVMNAIPSREALTEADCWVQQTFEGRVFT